jgi:hypothetical protein
MKPFDKLRTSYFIHCPVCPRLHEIVEITVDDNRFGDTQHIAHAYCDALGKTVTARLELARRMGDE